jgi:N6-adenosine-specific RNA methylase IME4/ParB-like chromosome segregation protein Spo0J
VQSIKRLGLRHPITVRPRKDDYLLVAGGHRLEAYRKLGNDFIPAVVSKLDDLEAEIWEIDENYCRNELSPCERSAAQTRRKKIYQGLHPETKAGGDRRSNAHVEHLKKAPTRYDQAAAEATGQSPQTIRREVHRGEVIGREALAKMVRTSLDKGDELDALATLPAETRNVLIERACAGEKVSAKTELKKERRAEREQELAAKQAALPTRKYGVIVADPEWRFEPRSRETGLDRAADNHYPTSTLEVIKSRDVAAIAADDCVLFLWATAPMLPQALEVMDAWGFEYRSNYVWLKDHIGTGYWNRNAHEHLLVGMRGNVPAPALGTQWDSVVEAAVGDHSAKPAIFLEMVEEYYPNLPKIELNRRGAGRPGWDAWGNEADVEVAA